MKNIRTNIYSLLIFCIIGFSCTTQKTTTNLFDNQKLLIENFNRSLQEKNSSTPEKYKGVIVTEKLKYRSVFHYVSTEYKPKISVYNDYSDFYPLFEKGYLNPTNIVSCFRDGPVAWITDLREKLRPSDVTRRRYTFLRWCKGVLNPCEYIIEIQNENANADTPTKEFVEGAILTEVSNCYLHI